MYVEGVDFLPGLAGESRTFDPNGPYVRVILTGGTLTYSLSPGLFGTAIAPITGVQPQLPATHPSGDGALVPVNRPPLKSTTPCETQRAISETELNDAPTGNGPQPTHAAMDTPGAKLYQQSLGLLEIAQLEQQGKEQGFAVRFSPSGKAKSK